MKHVNWISNVQKWKNYMRTIQPIRTWKIYLMSLSSPQKIVCLYRNRNIPFGETQAKNIIKKGVRKILSLSFWKILNPDALYFSSKDERAIPKKNDNRPIQGDSTLVSTKKGYDFARSLVSQAKKQQKNKGTHPTLLLLENMFRLYVLVSVCLAVDYFSKKNMTHVHMMLKRN